MIFAGGDIMLAEIYSKPEIQELKTRVNVLVKEMKQTRSPIMRKQILDQITEYNVIIWDFQKIETR